MVFSSIEFLALFLPAFLLAYLATPAAGQVFVRWTGGPCDGSTSATCTFTFSAAIYGVPIADMPGLPSDVIEAGSTFADFGAAYRSTS